MIGPAGRVRSGPAVGIAVPQITGGHAVRRDELAAFLERAEDNGYTSLWVFDDVLGAADGLEPLTLLSYVAAQTRTARLGVAVLVAPLRLPPVLARTLASLDQLSEGRLIVGLGLGEKTWVYPMFGLDPSRRARRFTETVEVLRRTWTEETPILEGEFFRLDGRRIGPRPIQPSGPPLWFGGKAAGAINRAARYGHGWIGAGASSTADFAEQVPRVREALAAAGRADEPFTFAKRVYVAVDDQDARLRGWLGSYYGDPSIGERVAVAGDVGACVEGLAAVLAAGADLVILNPVFDPDRHVEVLRDEVLPRLGWG